MNTILVKSIARTVAIAALACAPRAFAGHGRYGGYGHYHGHYGHAGYYHGGYGHGGYYHYHHYHRYHRYYHDHHYYHRDHFGRWVAGAVVLGALTHLVIDATQPRTVAYDDNPPVVYSRTRVVYRSAPVERVYEDRTVYYTSDPYQTRYIGHDDRYDSH